MKTLLIISGGIEAVPGIQLAKEMGLFVVVSDADADAPGFRYADEKIIASTYDVDDTVNKAYLFHKNKRSINGVMCIASDVPLTVAKVASALGLPGIPIESAELAMNKLAMKDRFSDDGVPVPQYSKINNLPHLHKIVDSWGYPLVLKPTDSRGARGVLRLTHEVDIEWAWEHSKSNSPTGHVMVERYIAGPQVSTESVMIDGKCYTPGFSDRNYELMDKYAPFIIENGGDLPSSLPDNIQIKVRELVQRAAISMGIRDGIVKGDIVVENNEPLVIELAARLSGGYFCTHEIPMNSGVDIVGNAIRIALGEPVDPRELKAKYNRNICQRYLFPEPGIIKKITGLDRLDKNNQIKYFDFRLKPGEEILPPVAHPSRPGMVITTGKSRAEAQEIASLALGQIEIVY
jgi:biotin carboxylase